MSIPTPTAEPLRPDAYGGAGGPPLDVDALARLANAFFAALPGAAPVPTPGLAAGGLSVPSRPQPPGAPTFAAPHPATAQGDGIGVPAPQGLNLVPQTPDAAAARLRPSTATLPHAAAPNGLPDAITTTAPGYDGRLGAHALGAVPAPGAPFYFLEHASPPRSRPAVESASLDALLPPSLEAAASPAPASPVPSAPSRYYFVEPTRHPGPHGHPGGAVPDHAVRTRARAPFDVHAIRRDFPILAERPNGKPLVWFDNAATTQKPRAVIDRLVRFYEHENSNVHRAAHALAARATDAYEHARSTVARFLGATSPEEIVFVRGATEGINLVARTWGVSHVGEGDEIVVSQLEHHANIVPWQQLAAEKGARIRVAPVDESGQLLLGELDRLIGPRTRLVAVTQVSNALGTVVPVHEVVAIARRHGVATLVDGAQSVSHMPVDVRSIGCDFFVFSGHKVFGPTGIGAVYGRAEVLAGLPPWQGGGNMIADVTFERTVYQDPPLRFEAGTGNIADAAGLAAALDYVQRIGLPAIGAYEHALLEYATDAVRRIPGLRILGTADHKASVLSFVLAGHAPIDVGRALDAEGIAVRAGHHCAQPILRRFGVEASVRPSFAFYNTCEEIDRMIAVLRRLARA
ncbi:MAG: family 2A encapsulin nanocompartment cargo protein cysteine desulfurase [Burkholderiales bacterium]|jgi:cysteine desulfurase/selenocysteine lyase